jgi:nicotinate-nucleotide--dimethylbenzimidazole phosphoribosyltransferase
MNPEIQKIIEDIEAQASTQSALEAVSQRISQLTMPPRAMGRALDLVEELTFAAGGPVACEKPQMFLFACEHGVTVEGVSAFPAEVTRQMVLNFIAGGAAINQLTQSVGADLTVVNIATAGDYPKHPQLVNQPVAPGTKNLLKESALDEGAMNKAILMGVHLAAESIDAGHDILSCGEMGIGNTTASACLTMAFTGCSVEEAVGRGTGLDETGVKNKMAVVAKALERAEPQEPLEKLKEWGGYELAGILGVILECARQRVPFILDGFNVTAAAAVAKELAPRSAEVMLASHQGAEPGHRILLESLNKKPYLEWQLRLGEGSGAALFLPLCRAASHMVNSMATFEEAAVSSE